MKLAEALQERADLNRNIDQLQRRLINNLMVQEGEETAEDPLRLKEELDISIKRLTFLITHINLTNCQTTLDGQTLTELIAKKDTLTKKLSIYKDSVLYGSQTTDRARNSEIKIKSTISIAKWQSEIDLMAKELRLLDNQLQACNWTTDLIE